jgi:hypothetical protein
MDNSHPLIFIAIAAYCDPILPRTLDDCLAKAYRPENLRFGICWQFDKQHPVDLTRFTADSRFRFSNHSYEASEGGSWARSIAQQFWDGEEFALQVDSHMEFAPAWDANLVRMIRRLPADKPLITMNAPLFRIHEDGRIWRQTDLGIRTTKLANWSESTGWSTWFSWGSQNLQSPGLSRFVSGNFIFTLGSWTEEVRQDPEHYYWGEEFALTLRSYTHGFDLFLPEEIPAWHMEHLKGPPRRHWEHGRGVVAEKNRVAFDRLRKLVYSDDPREQKSLGRYGLGSRRSRLDYERYAGMNLRDKRAHPHVYSGQNPDPVTIKSEADWGDCLTYEAFAKSAGKSGN